ncbi:MAG: hypothetical protein AB1351_00225 [Thermoproteota archaeon]
MQYSISILERITIIINNPISIKLIKEALDKTIDDLGPSIKQWIYEDLMSAGMIFDPCKSYSINELHAYLEQMGGKDTADLIVERMLRLLGPRLK